jgi:hypothetical protein
VASVYWWGVPAKRRTGEGRRQALSGSGLKGPGCCRTERTRFPRPRAFKRRPRLRTAARLRQFVFGLAARPHSARHFDEPQSAAIKRALTTAEGVRATASTRGHRRRAVRLGGTRSR